MSISFSSTLIESVADRDAVPSMMMCCLLFCIEKRSTSILLFLYVMFEDGIFHIVSLIFACDGFTAILAVGLFSSSSANMVMAFIVPLCFLLALLLHVSEVASLSSMASAVTSRSKTSPLSIILAILIFPCSASS